MLIAIHGKKRHGKTTIANHLLARHGFVRMRFARAIKEIIGWRLLGLSEAQTDGELKERPSADACRADPETLAARTVEILFPKGGASYALSDRELVERWAAVYVPLRYAGGPLTPRAIMQVIGGGARTYVSEMVWIDLWRDTYRAAGAARVVVDDLRYPNEITAVRAEGGEVWRSVRTDLPIPPAQDSSETACDHLPDEVFDAVIRRATGVPELLADVDRLVQARLLRAAAGLG